MATSEYAWLREFVEVPRPGAWFNVGESLSEHGVHGRQAALPVCIERSRDLQAQVFRTPMAGPTLCDGVESFIEFVPEGATRVI